MDRILIIVSQNSKDEFTQILKIENREVEVGRLEPHVIPQSIADYIHDMVYGKRAKVICLIHSENNLIQVKRRLRNFNVELGEAKNKGWLNR